MKTKNTLCAGVIILLLFLTFSFDATVYAQQVSKPGQYSGYSQPIYSSYVRSSVYVPGHDGTKLAVDIYRPSMDGVTPVNDRCPAVVTSHPAMSRRALFSGYQGMSNTTVPDLVKNGYVVVIYDLRGIGASYGQHHGDFNVDERLDTKAVIEWIAAQSWCTGHVGMLGVSYAGSLQHVAASSEPPHLIEIMPTDAVFDTYKQFYPNGVSALPTVGPPALSLSGVPVDEDPAPGYPLLAAAIQTHYGSTSEMSWRVPGMFRDAWSNDTMNKPLIDHSPQTYAREIGASGVNIYEVAGWFDHHVDEQLVAFKAFGGKAIVGPWTHAMNDPILTVETYRWLDHTLKGIENRILDEPPLYYYTINAPQGKEWRFGPEWPLPDRQARHYFFSGALSGTVASINDGGLATRRPLYSKGGTSRDDYTVDYSISVFNGKYRRDQRSFAGDMTPSPDTKGLTYTTAPLDSDMEVTGNPIAHLWVTSTALDGYFFVYLEEVDSSGFSHYVTDGVMRASFRKIAETPMACEYRFEDPFKRWPYGQACNLCPASLWETLGIPYHRGFEEDYTPLPDRPTELVFELFSTSYILRKGNRIRVTITCGEKEFYQIPATFVSDPAPVVSIYRDAKYPSFVTLPVIPSRPTVFEGTARVKLSKTTYTGSAELYVWKTAVYLHFDDKWMKWDTINNWTAGATEYCNARGDQGQISVVVMGDDHTSFNVLATGKGIHFEGKADN